VSAVSRIGFNILALLLLVVQALAQEAVLVPSRVIYPGETVTLAALREVVLKPGKVVPDAVATTPGALDGKVAKRTLLPGHYIPEASLRQAWLVEQGAPVQAILVAGGLTITAAAVTLQPGAAGDLVQIRNIDSGKIVTGTVMADGSIRIGAI
jgi:flagella basal body P-ring formation protein FlgA